MPVFARNGGRRIMVYRNYHNCGMNCKRLATYTRINDNWTKIGYYGSECKRFEPLDLQKEEQDRLTKERMIQLGADLSKVKQESRARLKIIESEFNMNKAFFK